MLPGSDKGSCAAYEQVFNRVLWDDSQQRDVEFLMSREWLVTNGLGGYASGSIAGISTRRYHGVLVAALAAPLGRTMMLNHVSEQFRLPGGTVVPLGGHALADGTIELHGVASLASFRLEMGLPVWRYRAGGFLIEKRVVLPHGQNTAQQSYRVLEGTGSLRLRIRPSVYFRPHESPVAVKPIPEYTVTKTSRGIEISEPNFPPLRLHLFAKRSELVLEAGLVREVFYRIEQSRGYDAYGSVWSPGYFRADLQVGEEATLLASTEAWDTMLAIEPASARQGECERRQRLIDQAPEAGRHGLGGELVLAADQFIIRPATRVADNARAHAAGDELRAIIAGYHWFTDWGRDTMISLEGLTLDTGRRTEAGYILRNYAFYVRDGLIPNLFPEGEHDGLYHTADATLWYFHALNRYVQRTGDRATLRLLLPVLRDIVEHHRRGTRFNIHVDPQDGLLSQGQAGYQLTWMDAKVGDWVVTPRRGKAVEINALWYNALRLMQQWHQEEGDPARAAAYAQAAQRALHAFNERFWYAAGQYLYDVVDTEKGSDDHALRPNQILAVALDYPVLERQRWEPVLHVVTERLLTPMGLRSLAPGDPNYKPQYDGDLRSRDAAYHQGTVWAWLIGPFIDAWLKVHPDRRSTAREFLAGFEAHLSEACVGSISEIFDAEAPYLPRGCVAQAWSVAEVLRCWVKTAPKGNGEQTLEQTAVETVGGSGRFDR
jgi:predicted glycogen debranching enzyme